MKKGYITSDEYEFVLRLIQNARKAKYLQLMSSIHKGMR